jgi:hypothetical protein
MIPDKPFSARSGTDWTRILEDGSTVRVYLETSLARDWREDLLQFPHEARNGS